MNVCKLLLCISILLLSQKISAQGLYSFEGKNVPSDWMVDDKGQLSISNFHYKDSVNSLRWDWKAGSIIHVNNLKKLSEDSKNPESVFWGWVYNPLPKNDSIQFVFTDDAGTERGSFYFKINFKGWRFMWMAHGRDFGYSYQKAGKSLANVKILAPQAGNGILYFDMFESRPKSDVNWHRYSDKQYTLKGAGANWRNIAYDYEPVVKNIDSKDDAELAKVKNELYNWFTGDGKAYVDNPIYIARRTAVEKSIVDKKTARWAISRKLRFREINDGIATTVVADTVNTSTGKSMGIGLHNDMSPYAYFFNDINNGYLFDMAMNVALYKGNDMRLKQRMVDSVTRIMDWMYDQGYAEGSGLGVGLTQLRSAGFPFAFFLIHESIKDKERYNNYMNAIRWIARDSYDTTKPGSSADDIRGSLLSKLVYALCLKDPVKRLGEMSYFKAFTENCIAIAPGYYGLVKPDYSLYHHQMPYYSEYGDDAIHQAAIVLYLLRNSKFALSPTIYNNIKNGVLNLSDISCNYVVPASVSGRFPMNGRNIIEHLPALAYIGLSAPAGTQPDIAIAKAYSRLFRTINDNPSAIGMDKSGMAIQYSQSLGAAIALIQYDSVAPQIKTTAYAFTKFLPYSGLFAAKYNEWSLSVKGFSKYIIDFECIRNEGRYSRYLSYGNMQLMSDSKNVNNYTCSQGFDYLHYSGSTTINLPLDKIDTRGKGNNAKERNFGDETFLGGVALCDTIGMTSFQLHDNTFNNSFRTNKSVFTFGNIIYCMGSGIENNDKINETHTTLFQNLAGQQLLLNDASISTINDQPIDKSITIIKNSWNNTYIVYPQEGAKVHIEKRMQNHPDPTGKMPSQPHEYEIAWLNHGTNPSNKKYNYALVLNENQATVAALINTQSPLINVKQQDAFAHIIETVQSNKTIYGYAFFQPTTLTLNIGMIASVDCHVLLWVLFLKRG